MILFVQYFIGMVVWEGGNAILNVKRTAPALVEYGIVCAIVVIILVVEDCISISIILSIVYTAAFTTTATCEE